MPSLSLDESRLRAEQLSVTSYDVRLDLSAGDRTFRSTATIHFVARGRCDSFVDVKPRRLLAVRLNDVPLDVEALRDGRLALTALEGENELVVEAEMAYRKDGEGLHRAVDPVDGRHYTYAMSFLDAAPSIFACFDQPDLKAPYTFHVITPHDWVVVGNSPAVQVEPGVWELPTTPPLSTYFVTLVAGPYHTIATEHDGITLGLECRSSLAQHLDKDAEEIFTVTAQCFDEYHRLFGIRYPFGDYHQAFVPEFNAGAMENPGCVTFRDPLVFTSKVTRNERSTRAMVIAHEMAHQWFGDLVTMRWWDDLWLNESFAEYMGNRVTEDATEFRGAWVDAAFWRKRWGLEADQRPSTHPVAGNGARDAATALQDFDGISYAKGSAVLKQLNAHLGDDVFLSGVRAHLKGHAFGNATMQDLFSAWESAGAKDLRQWSAGWLRTPGLDFIRLDRSGPRATVVKSAPPESPAERRHVLSYGRHDPRHGWVTEPLVVDEAGTALPPEAADQPVVLDPGDQTWARVGLDSLTLDALPSLLPEMTDPVMRAAVWSAVQDAVHNALLEPSRALGLLEAGLPHETEDIGVKALTSFAMSRLADLLLADHTSALNRIGAAARRRTDTAPPGSGLQLAAFRAVVAAGLEADELSGWLSGAGLPDATVIDLDLRWRLLTRLSELGAVDRTQLQSQLELEPSTEASVHHVRCLAALPEHEAKAFAWERFLGTKDATNYELEAAGTGMWQRGHEDLTGPYVERYFAEVAGTARVRSGWLLAEAARAFFPRVAVHRATLEAAERLVADESLDPGLHRVLVDETDNLRKALRVLERFPAGDGSR